MFVVDCLTLPVENKFHMELYFDPRCAPTVYYGVGDRIGMPCVFAECWMERWEDGGMDGGMDGWVGRWLMYYHHSRFTGE